MYSKVKFVNHRMALLNIASRHHLVILDNVVKYDNN